MEEVIKMVDVNGDGKIDIKDIFEIIVVNMKKLKKNKELSGLQKKLTILNDIEIIFGSEVVNKYKEMIFEFINFYYSKFMKKCIKICC